MGQPALRGGSSISGDLGCGFLAGGGNPPSCFCTGTNSTDMSPGCATSAASRRRRWSNGAERPRRFLRWCEEAGRQLGDLTAGDIDNYVATQGKGRWARVSTANTVSALRAFLRYAAKEGWCSNRLAESISRPRLYQQESLPYAPDWSVVQQMLADVDTDKPRDIRDRAILLLLALYGMRSGEVAALRLDQIDWAGRTLGLVRLKRRQPQIYPLLPAVAEALARYIDTVRPPSSCEEVFLCMHAPLRPLKAGSIFDVANRRFVALGIEAAHRGGHALRHACAVRLLAEGLTLKEIGDHLGHRSTSATSIYAKVNMAALREVGAFDLGDVLMMLADVIDAYLTRQRSLGMRFESAGRLLHRFGRAIGERQIQEVTLKRSSTSSMATGR